MLKLALFFVAFIVAVLPVAAQTPTPTAHPSTPPVMDGWSNLGRYKPANEKLTAPAPGENRVVFFGDSITDAWARDKSFFPGKPYIGRGISGQTTMQMLVRFRGRRDRSPA